MTVKRTGRFQYLLIMMLLMFMLMILNMMYLLLDVAVESYYVIDIYVHYYC